MWRHWYCALAATLAATACAAADEDFPYEAYVVPAESEIYSGPSEPRYVTQAIPRGTKVDVYEQSGEWLGIRPPAGSYSWVAASLLTLSPEPGVAEAATDGVSSWIGSSAERGHEHQASVQLKRGERVEVLGKREVPVADGQTELWLKIAPPAGEFRWIHASQVSREPPATITAPDPAHRDMGQWSSRDSLRTIRSDGGREDSLQPEVDSGEASAASPAGRPMPRTSMAIRDLIKPMPRQADLRPNSIQDAVRQVDHESSAEPTPSNRSLSPDGFVSRRGRTGQRRTPEPASQAPPLRAAAPQRPSVPAAKPAPLGAAPAIAAVPRTDVGEDGLARISNSQMQRRLEEIDVELSLIVARDRSQWNLAALRREVVQLVEGGATPVDRGQARLMLEKIDQFAEAFGVEQDDGPLDLPIGSVAARKAALEAAAAPKYDGTGYLTPVRAARPVAPYALLDQSGNRVCYVTPVPGFNLREYENRKIGVFGKRGYMADLSASHLLAERVVDLDKQTR